MTLRTTSSYVTFKLGNELFAIAMRWRAGMIEGLGKKGEQFITVLDTHLHHRGCAAR